jgi:hypothetical protein
MQLLGVTEAGEVLFVLVEKFVTLWHGVPPSGPFWALIAERRRPALSE